MVEAGAPATSAESIEPRSRPSSTYRGGPSSGSGRGDRGRPSAFFKLAVIIQEYLNWIAVRDVLVLTRLDQLRALADPLRLRLVEQLTTGDGSVAELARVVAVPITRLYHHVELLLEAGLIELVETVRKRGAPERRYRALARRYHVDRSLLELSPGPDGATEELLAMSRGVLGGALESVVTGLRTGAIRPGTPGRGLLLQDRGLRLSVEGFQALATELPEFLDDFARRHKTRGGASYRLAAALFPSAAEPAAEPSRPARRKVR